MLLDLVISSSYYYYHSQYVCLYHWENTRNNTVFFLLKKSRDELADMDVGLSKRNERQEENIAKDAAKPSDSPVAGAR